jgi:phage shock protein B
MQDALIPILIVAMLFIGLPWLIFHYVTRWKGQATLTREDENLLDELHDLARRLDDRMGSIERIMTADNPNWRSLACDPLDADNAAPLLSAERGVTNQPSRSLGR